MQSVFGEGVFESIDKIVALVRDYVLRAKSGPTPAIFFFNNI